MKRPPRSGWATFFNGHAPDYEENDFTRNTIAEVDFLVEELRLKPGVALLDVGCGTGRHAIELARRGLRVTGIDISSGMLDQARLNARRAGVEVTWIESDAANFDLFADFDAAVCLCEGAFGLLGAGDEPIGQPLAILRNIARAMRPGARCLFTVLNAFAMCRKHSISSVREGEFDPVTLTERSECSPVGGDSPPLRERAFFPTELVLLFGLAGIEVTDIWGGTAGDWGRRPIDLDEMEIMVVGAKMAEPPRPPYKVFGSG